MPALELDKDEMKAQAENALVKLGGLLGMIVSWLSRAVFFNILLHDFLYVFKCLVLLFKFCLTHANNLRSGVFIEFYGEIEGPKKAQEFQIDYVKRLLKEELNKNAESAEQKTTEIFVARMTALDNAKTLNDLVMLYRAIFASSLEFQKFLDETKPKLKRDQVKKLLDQQARTFKSEIEHSFEYRIANPYVLRAMYYGLFLALFASGLTLLNAVTTLTASWVAIVLLASLTTSIVMKALIVASHNLLHKTIDVIQNRFPSLYDSPTLNKISELLGQPLKQAIDTAVAILDPYAGQQQGENIMRALLDDPFTAMREAPRYAFESFKSSMTSAYEYLSESHDKINAGMEKVRDEEVRRAKKQHVAQHSAPRTFAIRL